MKKGLPIAIMASVLFGFYLLLPIQTEKQTKFDIPQAPIKTKKKTNDMMR